ncbi:Mog1p/PsbP-like protein [Ophiobolus disseminans]|uniref:Mog1p/PsbP-like protein n=1 Tax=Ophiobolus disseminans TaxID=1469910 RepID=A0A6A7A355_9PLEO|nr:Mog1p/PsbP-like protein [Ophiobolus disseminans]
MSFTNTPLYGGALTVDLPSNFADTSQIREVPDHQEVYLDTDGYSSIVIEILEYVDKPSDEAALQYHFADLVDGTGDSTTILKQERVEFGDNGLRDKPALALTFIQTPASPPPKRKTPEFVYIHLLLLRLKEQGSDVVVSVNVPHYKGEYEEAKEGEDTRLMKDGWAVRERVRETLRVVEWGLFGG